MARLTQEEKDERKKRILLSATKLFARKGFDQTTIEEIARVARVAKGCIYNYFQTKEDIIVYFLDEEAMVVNARISENNLEGLPLGEQLYQVVILILDYLEPFKEFVPIFLVYLWKPHSRTQKYLYENYRGILRSIFALFEKAQQREEIRKELDLFLAMENYRLIINWIEYYWYQDTSPDYKATKEKLNKLLDQFLFGLQAKGSNGYLPLTRT